MSTEFRLGRGISCHMTVLVIFGRMILTATATGFIVSLLVTEE